MSLAQSTLKVQQQLQHALGTGHVPDEEKRRATQLLSRLQSPVKVFLIGPKGSGKSRLINMLVNDPVIPDRAELPPLEIIFGPQPRTVYLMGDGSETALDGLHLEQPVPAETAIVRAELPLPVLNRLSLTELGLTGSQTEQKAIVDWGTSRADIVLWCSQSFAPSEQALWASAQDMLKDHSFLVLTKADQLQMKGTLSERITLLESIVSEEFHRMFPVATIQAVSANGPDGVRDQELWTASGAKALVEAIQRQVETGQSADTDNALMFLNRYSPGLPHGEEGEADPSTAPQPEARKPQRQSNKTAQNRPPKAFRQALEFLQKRADLMHSAVVRNGPESQSLILDHCLDTANQLVEITVQAEQGDPSLSALHEDVMECSDMMVLFHLEKTEDAAADAVTLLLQLKKEISVAAAS